MNEAQQLSIRRTRGIIARDLQQLHKDLLHYKLFQNNERLTSAFFDLTEAIYDAHTPVPDDQQMPDGHHKAVWFVECREELWTPELTETNDGCM